MESWSEKMKLREKRTNNFNNKNIKHQSTQCETSKQTWKQIKINKITISVLFKLIQDTFYQLKNDQLAATGLALVDSSVHKLLCDL